MLPLQSLSLVPMTYDIHDDMTRDEAGFVQKKLVEFSDQFTPPRNYREIGVVLRDAQGKVSGGVVANTVWDWLQIGVLWLPEELRGQGHGHRLLKRVEVLGRANGCRHAKLDTFDFEARAFYESHGYVVRSHTANFPQGHTQYHLAKDL